MTKILKHLNEMKLVKFESARYIHSGKIIYIDRQAPQVAQLHLNTRLLSVQRSRENTDIHFSHIFSAGKEDMKILKIQISKTIDEIRAKIHSSGSEQLGIFCCDFFAV